MNRDLSAWQSRWASRPKSRHDDSNLAFYRIRIPNRTNSRVPSRKVSDESLGQDGTNCIRLATNLFILFFIYLFPYLFRLSVISLSCLFVAVVDLLLSLLPAEAFLRKHHRDRKFLAEGRRVVKGIFVPSFSLRFLSVFVHISRLSYPATVI